MSINCLRHQMVRTESRYAALHSITVRYAHCSDSLLGRPSGALREHQVTQCILEQ